MGLNGQTPFRNTSGLTLPFALILTFIFSALVAVSYLFVSINLRQMQSGLYGMQALAITEGVNEKIKARLNTKSKIQISKEQEEKLKSPDEEFTDEEASEEEDLLSEDEFNEETEEFDEYYADEILKISRFITFREPPDQTEAEGETTEGEGEKQNTAQKPEANVEMIGSIDIPLGSVLSKGFMLAVYKDEKINLNLKDIVPDAAKEYKAKLPIPVIKSLTPNYCEAGKRSGFVVNGENLGNNVPTFTNKEINIEDIKAGPSVEFLVGMDIMPGLTKFNLGSAHSEFYIIPVYDGSSNPVINEIRNAQQNQLLDAKAGQKYLIIMIYGIDLFLKKSPPVVIADATGINPQVKDQSQSSITVSLDIGKKVEPGIHSLIVATEGGLSNAWLFTVLPPDELQQDTSANTATVSSSLTLLEVRVVENLLPLIDEKENIAPVKKSKDDKTQDPAKAASTDHGQNEDSDLEEEATESEKLSPFANTDLETTWLLETSTMIGKTIKTVSEVIQRQIPNIQSALITNGTVTFSGGGFQIIGETTAMTTIVEPTYISNTVLTVEGPPEEPEEPIEPPAKGTKDIQEKIIPKSPGELGFTPGSLAAVYKEGSQITDLDWAVISMVGRNTIELSQPGLIDFHYEGDQVFQFVPPVISKEEVAGTDAEKHIVPKDFALKISNFANSQNILRSNLDQYAELADVFTNDIIVPKDEFDLPAPYMGLTYIEGTPTFDSGNLLTGKGLLIVDTRSDNNGRPTGNIEITGDSKTPIDFSGIVYVHGNLMIDGNVTINGALVVDNDSRGQIEFATDAIGKIIYNPRAIKQTLAYLPFTTKPGTVMISNKPINLEGVVQSGKKEIKLGASTNVGQVETPRRGVSTVKSPDLPPEEALVESEKRPSVETIQIQKGSKPAEEELIELF